MISGTLLIVDDNEDVLSTLELLLSNEFKQIKTASSPDRILTVLDHTAVTAVLLDMNFSAGINTGNEGLYWLQRIRELRPELPVIMLTAYGNVELAVAALKNGATDFILKPWNNKKLIDTLLTACQPERQAKKTGTANEPAMLCGNSTVMQELFKTVRKVAATNANILITGENGTGKEMLAREIHRLSSRNQKEMVSVDMGAVSETLFESELFGHEKGAFTDAKESRTGKFESAQESTLFLDEIANLPYALQAKLLATLQNREIIRLGSNKKTAIDIRLICATNQDLSQLVREKRFREDLLYRINTIHLELPPLRERGGDILALADFFCQRYAQQYNRNGLQIDTQAKEKLLNYSWPGNIRELQHNIERAVILCENAAITAGDILPCAHSRCMPPMGTGNLEDIECNVIRASIAKNNGNLSATAEQLGISRQTLYNKMKRYSL